MNETQKLLERLGMNPENRKNLSTLCDMWKVMPSFEEGGLLEKCIIEEFIEPYLTEIYEWSKANNHKFTLLEGSHWTPESRGKLDLSSAFSDKIYLTHHYNYDCERIIVNIKDFERFTKLNFMIEVTEKSLEESRERLRAFNQEVNKLKTLVSSEDLKLKKLKAEKDQPGKL